MNTYIISYDLRNTKDYNSLITAIRSYPKFNKVLESLWIIQSSYTAETIRDNLGSKMDNDDGLVVIQSAGIGAWFGVLCTNERLQENL